MSKLFDRKSVTPVVSFCTSVLALGWLAAAAQALDLSNPFNRPQMQPVREKWAVIVGVGKFQDPQIPALRFAEQNATALARSLKDPQLGRFAQDHVIELLGANANKQAVEDAVLGPRLSKKVLPNDLVILYFSTRTQPGRDGRPLLCSFDTLLSEADGSGIDLAAVLSDLRRRTQSKRILCLLDASPAAQDPAQPFSSAVEELARSAGVTIFSAAPLSDQSTDKPAAGSSAFLYYLLEGLKTGSGKLPFSVIAQYTGDSVASETGKGPGKAQTPVLAVAPDDSDILSVQLGAAARSPGSPAKVSIGHPVDELALKRPDLAHARAKPPAAISDSSDDQDDEDEDEEAPAPVDFGSYMTKMKQSIQKLWKPPKGFENRRVVTTFFILRDGTISQPAIAESSGVPAVDQSALEALKAASPLDPLPLGAPKSVQIRYQFDWKVSRN
ncbi:MAG TPA: TonB family protein [Candidatus Obscuribacterales bacterium]